SVSIFNSTCNFWRTDRIRFFVATWPMVHSAINRNAYWPGSAHRRPAITPYQIGHADYGCCVDFIGDFFQLVVVVRSDQSLCVGGINCHRDLWCGRLGGRLSQSCQARSERLASALEIFLAIRCRCRRSNLPLYDGASSGGNAIIYSLL